MPERKWLPAEWMDEVVPELGNSPADFIRRNAEGVLQLGAIEGDDSGWPATDVVDGQIICFSWYEHRGHRTLTIRADGSWSIDEPFDADTNCLDTADGYFDVHNDLTDLVRAAHEETVSLGMAFPRRLEVDGWTWSEGEFFRVTVLESGAVELVEVPRLGPDAARDLIAAERARQVEVEHFSAEHDDQVNAAGQLMQAARAYLHWHEGVTEMVNGVPKTFPADWNPRWWKPKSDRENLVRAGALATAEIGRLSRLPESDGVVQRWGEALELIEQAMLRLSRLPSETA